MLRVVPFQFLNYCSTSEVAGGHPSRRRATSINPPALSGGGMTDTLLNVKPLMNNVRHRKRSRHITAAVLLALQLCVTVLFFLRLSHEHYSVGFRWPTDRVTLSHGY